MDELFYDVEPELLYVTHEDSLPVLLEVLNLACREFGLDEALPEPPARANDVWYHVISTHGGGPRGCVGWATRSAMADRGRTRRKGALLATYLLTITRLQAA